MNLFVSDLDPCQAARNLDDKRVNKMILETAQMLCCALHARGIAAPYKPTSFPKCGQTYRFRNGLFKKEKENEPEGFR